MRSTPLTATLCVCVMGGGVGWPLLTGKQHEQGTGSKALSRAGKLEGRDGSPFGQQLPTPMSASLTRLGRRGLCQTPLCSEAL